jgi:hypothetical protein
MELLPTVMRGLVPRIHVFTDEKGVDGRDKPGHDDPLDSIGSEMFQ